MKWLFSKKPRFINYTVVNKNLTLKVAFFEGEVWLTQKQLAEIFGIKVATINEHLKKIFTLKDFDEAELIKKFQIQATDGKKYQVNHYRIEIMEEIQRRIRR